MNIMAPLSSINDLSSLIEAGADEFYFGFNDFVWLSSFGKYAELNRMSSFGDKASFPSVEVAVEVAKVIKSVGCSGFLALNSAVYSPKQIQHLLLDAEKFSDLVDGVIVGDLSLAAKLSKIGFSVTLSTMSGIYNSAALNFASMLGVKRAVLPRDISLKDIEKIMSRKNVIDTEVFIMRNGCKYSDSNCMFFHAREKGSLCKELDLAMYNPIFFTENSFECRCRLICNHTLYSNFFHKSACGICSLYRLNKCGIKSVKIVGRADNVSSVIEDVKLIRNCISLAEKCSSEKEYQARINIPQSRYEQCIGCLNCYYPKARLETRNKGFCG